MVDLDECVQRAVAMPVAGPPELRELERRAARHRRKRVAWRVVAAAAAVSAVILVALTLTRQTSPQVVITSGSSTTPRGWSTERDPAHGLSISYPPSWRAATSTLTPALGDPVVPIALGTYRLEPERLGECDIVPQRALQALGARDAFIAVYVYDGSATWSPDTTLPTRFGPHLPWFKFRVQCTEGVRGRVGQITFADHGLHLAVLIAIGTKATPQRQRELYQILDTLSVKAPAPTTETSTPAQAENVRVFDTGQCFDYAANPVACAALHTREDFASFTSQGSLQATQQSESSECDLLFEQYTGVALTSQGRYTIVTATGGQIGGSLQTRCEIEGPRGAVDSTTGSARRSSG